MQKEFKFEPQQNVTITAYGLNYKGMVLWCEYNGKGNLYMVEFAYDGKIESRLFYEGQLSA